MSAICFIIFNILISMTSTVEISFMSNYFLWIPNRDPTQVSFKQRSENQIPAPFEHNSKQFILLKNEILTWA